ncbi:MAG: TRAP transporter large permease subunit [Deltaproteobacteria bacterium]|nr:TRAP transporter large permease subunit [Deltaproteobacteria bacterium]
MSIELITVMMFGSLFFLLGLGLPVAFACGSVGVLFTAILQGPAAVNLVSTRIFGLMVQYLLAAIPLFIFMACVLERSGIIEELYELVYQWLGFLKGGVASATIIACTLLAAMVGVIGASEVTMGVIALPQMLKRKYNKFIACGSILAGGTLGILIPPSVMLIVYGLVDNSSIGQLYAGAILPGLLLASLFTAYVSVRCYLNPKLGPPVPPEDRLPLADRVRLLLRIIPPMILIFLVLGTIFTGIAAPTEAAGVGAAGAIVMTAVQRKLTWKGLVQAAEATLKSSAMVMWTIFGANIFVGLYVMVGGGRFVSQVLLDSGLSHWGIIIVMNLQVSFLSPPFGYALFYLKGVAPPEISTTDIWKSSAPFIGLQILGVIAVMVFPEIILWLPRLVYRG